MPVPQSAPWLRFLRPLIKPCVRVGLRRCGACLHTAFGVPVHREACAITRLAFGGSPSRSLCAYQRVFGPLGQSRRAFLRSRPGTTRVPSLRGPAPPGAGSVHPASAPRPREATLLWTPPTPAAARGRFRRVAVGLYRVRMRPGCEFAPPAPRQVSRVALTFSRDVPPRRPRRSPRAACTCCLAQGSPSSPRTQRLDPRIDMSRGSHGFTRTRKVRGVAARRFASPGDAPPHPAPLAGPAA